MDSGFLLPAEKEGIESGWPLCRRLEAPTRQPLATRSGFRHTVRMDTIPLPVFIIGCIAIVVLLCVALYRPPARQQLSYARSAALLTPCELRFYRVLLRAVPKGVAVFAKVRLMDVVQVPDYHWKQYGGVGSGMHLDFVLADAETTKILLVIELDDKSHMGADARIRDDFKDAALAAGGMALLRVKAAGRYSEGDVRGRIREALG